MLNIQLIKANKMYYFEWFAWFDDSITSSFPHDNQIVSKNLNIQRGSAELISMNTLNFKNNLWVQVTVFFIRYEIWLASTIIVMIMKYLHLFAFFLLNLIVLCIRTCKQWFIHSFCDFIVSCISFTRFTTMATVATTRHRFAFMWIHSIWNTRHIHTITVTIAVTRLQSAFKVIC